MAQRIDSLITAVIAKLPPAGPFAAADRAAWLRLMSSAFDMVYGPAPELGELLPAFLPGRAGAGADPVPPIGAAAPTVQAPEHAGYDYYIDSDGYACMSGGVRVTADDVPADETIYDCRRGPARDRDTIVWADDTRGARPGMSFCGPG